uniref:nuclear distribution protein nudE homolog 1 n=1 Tax=Ciona intestinalis TaxID=7719 RepID=UPI0002B8CFCA|nr:nuclear distribution protein nudE homolog 1 [Ciona intestinalis]|eukprot:XP_002127520.2 nuclear distribution protein nudE homolog 1 [Ciona intestinalis]
MAELQSEPPAFANAEEKAAYWEGEAKRFEEMTLEVQLELQEFRECSEEIEKELEAQLEQHEKQTKDLRQQNTTLTFEYESLKERYEKQQTERFRQVSDLQTEISKLTVTNGELTKDVRELEQRNDDLERTNRVIIVSLDDFEQRLNQALERNAFLESELDEKDSLSVTVQRLRDEARDLHHELSVRQRKVSESGKHDERSPLPSPQDKVPTPTTGVPTTPLATSKKLIFNGVTTSHAPPSPTNPDPHKIHQKHVLHNGVDKTPLPPSARISALNIVGDLLRKFGALESKLASCRNFVHEQPPWQSKRVNQIAPKSSETPHEGSTTDSSKNSSVKIRV